jgi:Glycosyl transferase family 8
MVDWITIPADKSRLAVSEVDQIKRVADRMCAAVESQSAYFCKSETTVCYVTLASPTYEWGLRVMLRSLRKVSQVPVLVLSSRRWTFRCDEPGVLLLEVPALVSSQYKPLRQEYLETLTKLWVFGLTCFRRITYVDADCLFLRSIDDLFDVNGFVAGGDYVLDATREGLNSGLFSFQPTRALRDEIFEQAHHTPSVDGGDQGLLNELLRPRVRLLPPEYDLMRHYHYYAGAELKRSETRMIHFIMKKPWELWAREPIDLALVELDDLWTSQLTRDELIDLVASWRRTQFIPRWDVEAQTRRRKRRHWRNRIVIALGIVLVALVFFWLGRFVAGEFPWPR